MGMGRGAPAGTDGPEGKERQGFGAIMKAMYGDKLEMRLQLFDRAW